MKLSLRARYTLILTLLLGTVIAALIVVNERYLGRFYLAEKQKTMKEVYNRLDQLVQSADGEQRQEELIRISEIYNISLVIVQDEKTALIISREPERLRERLFTYLYGTTVGLDLLPDQGSGGQSDENTEAAEQLRQKIIGDRIAKADRYQVYKAYDPKSDGYYLEFWGFLSDDYIFLMQTPLMGISENVKISNEFYLWVGLAAVLAGAVLMYLTAGRLTSPIRSLSGIAERISQLDFTARYEGKQTDEIGRLGNSMNRMSKQLEKTVSELKTANLELKRDLEQRSRMDEMRNEFISGVSHELKTPIALIQGYAEGLKEGVSQDPESMEFYCDVILDEAGRMNRMVKKLLMLNQIEFGGETPSVERFEVTGLLKGLLQGYQRTIEQNGIRLVFDEPETYVWADEFMIEEVLGNYLSNAFHYVKGEKRIEIRIERRENRVRILVFNTGDPIPEDERERVWQKFYKVDKARSREYGGNGIGLSIVKALMDKHGKPCGVFNTEDGVVFWLELDGELN